jgi:hypothetical protein
MMASEDEAVTLDAKTIRHDEKPAETADPREGTDLAMMTARTMTTIHLHEERKEAVVAAKISRRTARVNDNATFAIPTREPPWWRRWWQRTGKVTQLSQGSAGTEALRRPYPSKRDCQVSNSLLPRPKVLRTTDS